MLRGAFGSPDGDYIDYYCDVKEREWKKLHELAYQLGSGKNIVVYPGLVGRSSVVRAEHMGTSRMPVADLVELGLGIPLVTRYGLVSVAKAGGDHVAQPPEGQDLR